MGDNISRQAAIDAIQKGLQDWDGYAFEDYRRGLYEAQDILEALPSTDRIGHWILDPDGNDWNLPAWICSECYRKNDNIGVVEKGIGSDPRSWVGAKFCPECGARMSGKPEVRKKRCL